MTLRARLWPAIGRNDDDDGATITVYIVTGRHGLLHIPESFCRECHLFVRRAEAAADAVDADVTVRVQSWWTGIFAALRHGGYHPPVMVVGGRKLAQGENVPTTGEIVAAIQNAAP
ncbi:MAG: hypothetical protein SVU88_04735 [Candidatus Nanohaloarchaea archaeon]|nr:hypothetical protein [Candidatus Nanohaloarchaea archaeon]